MCDRHQANIWTARIMPVVLAGMAGYATYVFIVRLCVHFLLNPPVQDILQFDPLSGTSSIIPVPVRPPRTATAIGLMVGYLILLVLMGASFMRLVYTVLTNPGFVPLGPHAYRKSGEGKQAWAPPVAAGARNEKNLVPKDQNRDTRPSASRGSRQTENENAPSTLGEDFRSIASRGETQPALPPRQPLTPVVLREIYLCDVNGEPRYCGRCGNWKPDRVHHCSEVGRCVENFDHFCPWVGGVVGLTSYKFFVQFITFGSIFCIYCVICMAIFFQQKVSEDGFQTEDGHWVAVIALGGFFGLFLIGMFITSVQMLYWGSSTLENFDRKTKRYFVARLDPDQDQEPAPRRTSLNPRTISRGPDSQPFWQQADETRDVDSGYQRRVLLPPPAPQSTTPHSSSTASSDRGKDASLPVPSRYYRIYLTPSGLHPWRIGFKRNFLQIMGPRVWDWLLPTYRPYRRPKSRDDGELAEGVWSAKQLWKQMNREGWSSGDFGAAMAREGGIHRWYDFSDDFIRFLDSCDK